MNKLRIKNLELRIKKKTLYSKLFTQNSSGQILLILLLVMVVALAISLSIIQRSLSDLSNATKVEQSTRAFSAAEAGIEKALRLNSAPDAFSLDTTSQTNVQANIEFPRLGEPLEYPALAKEDVAHVWLADYKNSANPPPAAYIPRSLEIYWGGNPELEIANPPVSAAEMAADKAAIEVTLLYYEGAQYKTKKFFFDSDSIRTAGINPNGFTNAPCNGSNKKTTNLGVDRVFKCQSTVDIPAGYIVLLRARLLYNKYNQRFATGPVSCGACASDDIPYQASIFTSTGISGQTQRKIQVYQVDKVVPFYYDFAIFSAGEIAK